MIDGAIVWQTGAEGAGFKPVQLPGTKPRDRVLRGQILRATTPGGEEGTLVWGLLQSWKDRTETTSAYLARFADGEWKRVALDVPIIELSQGKDGVIWAIRGKDAFSNLGPSTLERLTFDASGAAAFEPVDVSFKREWLDLGDEAKDWLKSCVKVWPRSVAALDAKDVWLTAECRPKTGDGTSIVLHTQAQGPLVEVPELTRDAPPPPKPKPR
jgi:hypothetical protein